VTQYGTERGLCPVEKEYIGCDSISGDAGLTVDDRIFELEALDGAPANPHNYNLEETTIIADMPGASFTGTRSENTPLDRRLFGLLRLEEGSRNSILLSLADLGIRSSADVIAMGVQGLVEANVRKEVFLSPNQIATIMAAVKAVTGRAVPLLRSDSN
jgi:hypothetical protein